MTTTEVVMTVCYECNRERPEKRTVTLNVFDTPWVEMGEPRSFCIDQFGHYELLNDKDKADWGRTWEHYESCASVLNDHGWADFRYFDCVECKRTICEQNPKNGWHQQFKRTTLEEYICLRCYTEDILEHGIHENLIANRGVGAGVFFNHGNPEVIKAGYELLFDFIKVAGTNAEEIKQLCLKNIHEGFKIVICIERLSTMGDEGWVSVYRKK
jgi:hypothetical protein